MSDAGRMAAIDRLFEQALELEGHARAVFLAELDGREPELAGEVRELVALAAREDERLSAGQVLTGPLWAALDAAQPATAVAGERIGAYRVLSELGRGGMAIVYLAERADGAFNQLVALKLLQTGAPPAELLRRFEQERQILASLSHPAIAGLLDGGVDERGRPYIALEHVEGEHLHQYCDRRGLGLEARLDLFAEIARAVQHAHRNLVVHRDLKASNLLVKADGQVKLLDFGIAKLLDPAAAGPFAAPPTRTALRLMTPESASPEQVRGEVVTTASDVYQLGLLLYELLTGARAHRFTGVTAAEVERVICAEEPKRPSLAAISPEQARARGTTPAQLARRLRGDLDTIVMKALRKEPERRYRSPAALLDDLELHRTGQAIAARRDSVSYRAGKFARRHRFGLAVAALGGLLVVGYAVTVTLQASTIRHERDRARAEAAKAQEVKRFLIELFEVAGPEQALGTEITARQVLDRGSERLVHELGGQPEIQAEMLAAVGEIYRQLGAFDRGERLLRQAVAALERGGSELALERAQAQLLLGRLRREQGDVEEAETLVRQVLGLRRERLPAGDPAVAEALRDLGQVMQMDGRLDEAEAFYQEALGLFRARYGEEHEEVASTIDNLGNVARERGSYGAAEDAFRQALEMRRKVLPGRHPAIATSLANLALALRAGGRYGEAEPLFLEALALSEKVLGPDHAWGAVTLSNLAQNQMAQGRYAEAEQSLRRALAVRTRSLAADHPHLASNFNDLGRTLQLLGRSEEAEAAYREALARFAPGHRWRLAALFNLATLLDERGQLADAEDLYRQVNTEQAAARGADHPSNAVNAYYLGRLLARRQRWAEAETLLREGLELSRRTLAADHPQVAQLAFGLGELLLATGRHEQARPLLDEAAGIRRTRWGEADARTREVLEALARLRE